jgi:hypothetical protein
MRSLELPEQRALSRVRSAYRTARSWQGFAEVVFHEVSPTIHTPHSPGARGGSAERAYTRHLPEESVLYNVIQQELEAFLARAQAHQQPVPRFVEQESLQNPLQP